MTSQGARGGRWRRRATVVVVAVASVVACTSDSGVAPGSTSSPRPSSSDAATPGARGPATAAPDGPDATANNTAPSPRAVPAPTDLAADGDGEAVVLEGQAAPGAVSHEVVVGDRRLGVPGDMCDPRCTVRLGHAVLGDADHLGVASVADDGARSAVADVDVGPAVTPSSTEPPEQPPLAVTVVRTGQPPSATATRVESRAAGRRLIRRLRRQPDVLTAGFQGHYQPMQAATAGSDATTVETTWYAEALSYDLIASETSQGEGVTVAVVDTGVEAEHPSLAGAVLEGRRISNGASGSDLPQHHGTAMASLVVGQPAGVVPSAATNAEVLPVDVHRRVFPVAARDIHTGIVWAVDQGAQVINLSIGDICEDACPTDLDAGLAYAEQQGVVVVAAAGNEGDGCHDPPNPDVYPAVVGSVISVGALAPDGSRWACSSDRPDVDVLVPGADMLMAVVGGTTIDSGTSAAAAVFSGLVAVALGEDPSLTPERIRDAVVRARDGELRLLLSIFFEHLGIDLTPPTEAANAHGFEISINLPVPLGVPPAWEDPAPATWPPTGVPSVIVGGTFVIRGDGRISGAGKLQQPAGGTSPALGVTGFQVSCPISTWDTVFADVEHPATPELWFRWDIPVRLFGQVRDDGSADLVLSLGHGATATTGGSIGPMRTVIDRLDLCLAILPGVKERREDLLGGFGEVPYDDPGELSAFRNEFVTLVRGVHQEVVDLGPVTVEGIDLGEYDPQVTATPAGSVVVNLTPP